MKAVEHRDRQQVHQPQDDADGAHGDDQVAPPLLGRLARDVSDHQRAADGLAGDAPGDDARDAEGLRADEARRADDRAAGRIGDTVADPDALRVAEAVHVGERAEVGDFDEHAGIVVLLPQMLPHGEGELAAFAADHHLHGRGAGGLEGGVDLIGPGEGDDAADPEHAVSALEPGLFGGRAGLHHENGQVARLEAVLARLRRSGQRELRRLVHPERRARRRHRLGPKRFELNRAVALRELVGELLPVGDGLALQPHHFVEGLHPRSSGRRVGRDDGHFGCARHGGDADAAVPHRLDGIGLLVDRGDDAQGLGAARAQHRHLQRLARLGADLLLQRAPTVDRLAVDGDDPVAVAQARRCGRRLRLDVADLRGQLLVGRSEDDEVEHHREHEIRGGPGESDQAFLPGRLFEEGAAAVLGRDLFVRVVSGELDVSAQRQRADAIFRVAPGEAEEARAEADGKADRLDTQLLADEQVAELVEEDHHGDDHREGDERERD